MEMVSSLSNIKVVKTTIELVSQILKKTHRVIDSYFEAQPLFPGLTVKNIITV